VNAANPGIWLSDDEGGDIAVRVPVNLRQNDAAVWAWVPETDEQVVENEAFSPIRPDTGVPQNLTVETGDGVSTPTQARFLINYDAVEGAEEYEISLRQPGGEYEIVAIRVGNSNILLNVIAGVTYDVQVVAVKIIYTDGEERRRSEPVEVLGVTARLGAEAAPVLQPGVIAGSPIAALP
jgi:hypothetical protein